MILYINSCVRPESRTHRLAKALLEKLGEPYNELKLAESDLAPVTDTLLERRTALISEGKFDDPLFAPARQFAAADTIVISAPFWDGSFPSLLKVYFENIYIVGLVTRYNEQGIPCGLCRGKMLYYVTTSGGFFFPDFGYNYIKTITQQCFGIRETRLIQAQNLDLVGADPEKILQDAIAGLDDLLC